MNRNDRRLNRHQHSCRCVKSLNSSVIVRRRKIPLVSDVIGDVIITLYSIEKCTKYRQLTLPTTALNTPSTTPPNSRYTTSCMLPFRIRYSYSAYWATGTYHTAPHTAQEPGYCGVESQSSNVVGASHMRAPRSPTASPPLLCHALPPSAHHTRAPCAGPTCLLCQDARTAWNMPRCWGAWGLP